jgi:hypothetical protein
VSLPSNLLGRSASRLRSLRLWNCDLPWDSPLFHGLTRLRISGVSPTKKPTSTELLDALRATPFLELLHLDGSVPVTHERTVNSPRAAVVVLPRLTSFLISSVDFDCADLLDCPQIPTQAILDIAVSLPGHIPSSWRSSPQSQLMQKSSQTPTDGKGHVRTIPFRGMDNRQPL